ncbi:MAG: SDR family NAD(P)-dependent oxidoreductase [Gammaproteobacteria bacterium]
MKRKQKYADKIVIVTGASSGIGRATALAFAREGATMFLAARSREKLNQVADEIGRFGGSARVVQTDVSDRQQVEYLINRVVEEFGRIDVLINNAGGGAVGTVEDPRFVDDARHLLDVDFFGKVYCTQAVLPVMRRQGSGSIVNLSSVVGSKAFPRFGAYSASMHAVKAFSDALRQELRGSGVHVATVHPALTETAFFQGVDPADMPAPFRYMKPLTPDAVARQIVKAVGKRFERIIIPWQPRMLILSEALSARLGDLMVRLLAKPWFMGLIGMYQATRLPIAVEGQLAGKK